MADWLGWGSDSLLLITISTTLVPLGSIFGAMTGGASSRLGRRKFLMISNIVILWGSCINCIPTTPTFLLARFIAGLTVGATASVCPLYNAEFVPNEIRGPLGNVFTVLLNVGILTGYILSLPILWLGFYWLYIIFAFPIIPASIQLWNFMYYFKYEPPPWSIKKEKFDDAISAINQVYFEDYASS